MAVVRYLFKRRFSYFDMVPIIIAANLLDERRWIAALLVLLIGSIIALVGESA